HLVALVQAPVWKLDAPGALGRLGRAKVNGALAAMRRGQHLGAMRRQRLLPRGELLVERPQELQEARRQRRHPLRARGRRVDAWIDPGRHRLLLTSSSSAHAHAAARRATTSAGLGRRYDAGTLRFAASSSPSPSCCSAMSAIMRPIASDEVAAGDGALRTWITPGALEITKSSTSVPSRFSACARTPDGPGSTS